MTPTIESVGLRKRFGKTTALAGLDLVPSRGVGPGRARRDRQPMIWAAPKTSTPHLHTAERQGG
jgi:hypothetical protein